MKKDNVKDDKVIEKSKDEKATLLSLSYEIAALRNRNDLLRVVNKKLKKLFAVDGFGIAQISNDRRTYAAFVLDVEENTKALKDFEEVTSRQYSVDDKVFSRITETDEPVLFHVSSLVQEPEMPAYVHFWNRAGIPYVIGIAMRVGGENVGSIFLHYLNEKSIDIKTSLLKGVCAQLAVAISNIISNEEITEREEEKTILLSLSTEIAALRNRNDLLGVVSKKIKKLFSIKQFGIAQVNEDKISHSAFIMDLDEPLTTHHDFDEVTTLKYSISDKAFHLIATSDEPVILNVDELALEPDAPQYVLFWKEVGFKQLLCLALRTGGEIVGCIFFNIHLNELPTVKINLLKGVCSQLRFTASS